MVQFPSELAYTFGGHVAALKESTLDCVKILQRSMTGVSSESQTRLVGTTFFWDRGYGGTEGEVNQWTIKAGANLLGTSKRMRSFPFTFDQSPGRGRRLVLEKGAACQYWAQKSTQGVNGTVTQYALAFRNGLRRVVLMQTTDGKYGPGHFTFVTKSRSGDIELERHTYTTTHTAALYQMFDEQHCDVITATQRSPEWFNQRMFRVTGTSALALWNHYACRKGVPGDGAYYIHEHFHSVFRVLSIKHRHDVVDAGNNEEAKEAEQDNAASRIYNEQELMVLRIADLKTICRQKNLTISGSKKTLIERILASGGDESSSSLAKPKKAVDILLGSWFMAPFGSANHATRIGSINEANVLPRISMFVDQNSSTFHIEEIKEYGLLCTSRW